MNVVVTGGAGFIGSHLVEHLVSSGESVTVIDNLTTGTKENLSKVNTKINFLHGDIRDISFLEKSLKNADEVYHEAALASVQDSFSRPEEYFDVNVKGTENIFKFGKEFGFKIVYASSSSVYGDTNMLPTKENSPKNPINPYAKTKLEAENLAKKYTKNGVKIIGLRYFNVFGERQSKEYAGVIKLFLERIQLQKPLLINGDGLQVRDFVYVGDVVKANVLAMKSNVDHAFINIGTGTSISVLKLAKIIINASGLPLKNEHRPALDGDVRATQADITLALKLINWKPTVSLEQWLKNIISQIINQSN